MSGFTLAELARMSGGYLDNVTDPERRLSAPVVVDSRDVAPGGVFVAIAGERVDGHTFAADAVRAGALLVVSARPLDEAPALVVDDPVHALGRMATAALQQRPDLTVIGITGSNGKTTTKDLLASVLATYDETIAAPGSYNGEIGLPLSVLGATPSTRFLVLEYGARGVGHIRYLTEIARPNVGVVLNVGVAHIGVFGDVEAIAEAKGELVEAVPVDGVAVLNADDPTVLEMRARTRARVVSFGRTDADVCASRMTLDDQARARFTLTAGTASATVDLRLHGAHQVSNALAAAAAAMSVGMPLPDVATALSSAVPTSPWRMEVFTTESGITVVNDAYNANPGSVDAGLRAVSEMSGAPPWRTSDHPQAKRRVWAVLGHMAELGEGAERAHVDVGWLAAQCGVDRLIAVGPEAARIVDGARAGGLQPGQAERVADVEAAIALLRSDLAPGDIVFVKASRSAGLERVALALVAGPVPA